MKKIEIDLHGMNSIDEAHERLRAAMGFPEYYGKNLDALFDCLTDITEDTCVGVRGPKEGGVAWYLPRLQRVFGDAERMNPHLCVFFLPDGKENVQASGPAVRLAAERTADQPEEICAVQPDPEETEMLLLRAEQAGPEAAEIMGVYGTAAVREDGETEAGTGETAPENIRDLREEDNGEDRI